MFFKKFEHGRILTCIINLHNFHLSIQVNLGEAGTNYFCRLNAKKASYLLPTLGSFMTTNPVLNRDITVLAHLNIYLKTYSKSAFFKR